MQLGNMLEELGEDSSSTIVHVSVPLMALGTCRNDCDALLSMSSSLLGAEGSLVVKDITIVKKGERHVGQEETEVGVNANVEDMTPAWRPGIRRVPGAFHQSIACHWKCSPLPQKPSFMRRKMCEPTGRPMYTLRSAVRCPRPF